MSWQQTRELAIRERFRTVCDVLGLSPTQDVQFVRAVLERFLHGVAGTARERAWNTIAYVLSQAFHCRVPTNATVASFRAAHENGSFAGLYRALVENETFRSSVQAAAPLVVVENSGLAVDVSETARIPFTSGIQRVVRSIARHLPEVAPDSMLIRWSELNQCFTPLTESDIERLLSVEPTPPEKDPPVVRSSTVTTMRSIREAALWPTRELERTIRRRRRLKATQTRPVQASVFLWSGSLLIPELAVGEDHVEAIRLVNGVAPLRTSIVFYDAIPIRYPEYFGTATHSTYLRSLSLARDVDAVSCISEAVRDHIENLLAVMPRRRPARVAVHTLGADLPENTAACPGVTFNRPAVLCVGTVEPRKNQLRILEAMTAAQRAGSEFTGVFAGNAGWFNGRFREALAGASAAGHDLQLRENVTNDELRGLYAAAAFTVYCSIDEGFGLPIIESLRQGRPCITSNRGSMREISDQTGGCLVVDPENVDEIAAAITRLMESTDTLARLTREAEASQWPTWREYTEELVEFATVPSTALETRRRAA